VPSMRDAPRSLWPSSTSDWSSSCKMASMARGDAARSATGAIVTGARERRAMAVRVVLFKTTRISSPPTSTSAAATDAVQHNAQPEQFKTTRLSNHEVFATFIGLSTVGRSEVPTQSDRPSQSHHTVGEFPPHCEGCVRHTVREPPHSVMEFPHTVRENPHSVRQNRPHCGGSRPHCGRDPPTLWARSCPQ
jgi:hypothetical protein